MDRRLAVAVALAAVMLLAGCSVGFQGGDGAPRVDPGGDATTPEPTGPSERLGYYDGYWHNDTLDIDASDGLSDTEQEAVVSRAMARVQLLRGLEFEERVEVDLLTREEFREEFGDLGAEPSDGVRALDNAQHEALFLVGPDRDVIEVREGNRGDLVLGFYQPSSERLVVVSSRDPATLADEITLAHELVHALQDQHFGLESVESDGTLDGVNARNGLIEGDAVVVENAYTDRCESGEWQCIDLESSPPRPGEGFHFGVYFVGFFPYAEGPSFIQHHRDRGGWGAVDAMYDAPPTAAAEIVHPDTYGSDAYTEATVTDRSAADWERVRTASGPDYSSVGQSGLVSMFAYTAFDSSPDGVIDPDEFRNLEGDQLDDTRPFTYDVAYADGWRADRLHAYDNGEAGALVWNVTFNDAANASEFQRGYVQVARYHGGEEAASRDGAVVWRFDESNEFRGAVWVRQEGNTVTVVRAPSIEDLDDVYAPAG